MVQRVEGVVAAPTGLAGVSSADIDITQPTLGYVYCSVDSRYVVKLRCQESDNVCTCANKDTTARAPNSQMSQMQQKKNGLWAEGFKHCARCM
jgi:hypothetical protein